jgi:hypothetical protein
MILTERRHIESYHVDSLYKPVIMFRHASQARQKKQKQKKRVRADRFRARSMTPLPVYIDAWLASLDAILARPGIFTSLILLATSLTAQLDELWATHNMNASLPTSSAA